MVNDCIAQCGIRRVLTSRKVLERFPLKLDAELLFLEDFPALVRRSDKLLGRRRRLAAAGLAPGTPAGPTASGPTTC